MWKEELFLHRQAARARALKRMGQAAAAETPPAVRDAGNLVVMEDSGGIVSRRNDFNLDRKTLSFLPLAADASRYTFQVSGPAYDRDAASAGTALSSLGDDDFRSVKLPFAFPYFGVTYSEIFVNSDGNLTFVTGDGSSADRSLGRLNAGTPRMAPLFEDLDPSAAGEGVRVLAEPGRLVVSWAGVREYSDAGLGKAQTFQARLYPDGRIEFAYNGISTSGAVVGITPGGLKGSAALVSFGTDTPAEYPGAVAERFGGTLELDVTTAAQRFYETHEDAYDYLVFFNNLQIPAAASAVAYEFTVRNSRTGYGDQPVDVGREFGSAGRLQSVMNMGPLSQYPASPDGRVPARATVGDTPVTVIAHESGHLFLAYASVRDPNDPAARPMLGFQNAHWFFGFNSEASLLEGNRIQDRGENAAPRFLTTGAVQGFSPLDQYLMGLRAAEEVEPEHNMFVVTGTPATFARRLPQTGFGFDGGRRDVHIDEIAGVEGRRTPDYTVAQRRFRFAFVLVVGAGTEPSADELAKLESFRTAFEAFYPRATSDRAVADTSLKRNLRLSLYPASGVLAGGSVSATVSVDTAPSVPLTVAIERKQGVTDMPASVVIPAGAKTATFSVVGIRAGVEDLLARPGDDAYHVAAARIQVASPVDIKVVAVTGSTPDQMVVRATDINDLPYPGARLAASASPSGSVTPATAVADENGRATFRWTPGASPVNELRIGLEGSAPVFTMQIGSRVVTAAAVTNAASVAARIAPGSLATIYGQNLAAGATEQARTPWPQTLASVSVLLDGKPAPVVFVSDTQINFLVPPEVPEGTAELTVSNALGVSSVLKVAVTAVAPGIFPEGGTEFGAVRIAGSGLTTSARAARTGEYLEVYATGLGPVRRGDDGVSRTTLTTQATIGGVPAPVVFSGMTPGYDGLYQVNVQVPAGAGSGPQPLVLTVGGVRSNEVRIGLE